MTDSTSLVFNGITPAHFSKLTEKARDAGIAMSGNTGRASKMGVEVEWSYSEPLQELTLSCLRTPFFLSRTEINARLSTLVKEALSM